MSSFLYKNITIYRAVMQLLYKGGYYRRFDAVKEIISKNKPASVVELCFGDTVIAHYCRDQKMEWKGFDCNAEFVERAKKNRFDAYLVRIDENFRIPDADLILMMGSLYHFDIHAEKIVLTMLASGKMVVISEPVKNLAQKKSLKKWAAKLSNAGRRDESFRFNRKSLLALAEKICTDSLYSYRITHEGEKDLVLVLAKK